jgi:hypothetical protein
VKKPKDMTTAELQKTLKKTRADRAEMRMRVSGNPNLSAYDKQIEECEKELAKRNTKDGNNGQVR